MSSLTQKCGAVREGLRRTFFAEVPDGQTGAVFRHGSTVRHVLNKRVRHNIWGVPIRQEQVNGL